MSFGAPTPPDPTATANTQQTYNTQAAQTQNKTNSYNQAGPGGSMTYVADPNSPSGYSLQTSAGAYGTPLLNTATSLAQNSAGMYSQPTDLSAATGQTANLLNSWQQQYLQPIFNQQQSNTDAQLRNQGLAPGTEAYNNAKNLQARNQGDVTNQYETMNLGNALKAQNQNFGQQVTNYEAPLQAESGLLQNAGTQAGYASPTAPTFQQTPTAQIQPANYQGAVQQNYTAQNQNYENMLSGIFGVGSGLAGGWAKGGFSGLSGLFGSSPNGGGAGK